MIYKSTRSQAKRIMVNQVNAANSNHHHTAANNNMLYAINNANKNATTSQTKVGGVCQTTVSRSKMITPAPVEPIRRQTKTKV